MKKIAVCGKGGVGKTTFAALLACCLADNGEEVYAIDADVNPTLAEALGFSADVVLGITPIVDMEDLIAERTGAKTDEYGSYFKTNPYVKDIPEKFSRKQGNINFLLMGAMKGADQGCACAQNAMLRALVTHLILKEKETVIMDMVAGTEHMGRGTAKGVDIIFLVVEPGIRSIKAAKDIAAMSRDLGIKNCFVIGNKIRSPEDEAYIKNLMNDFHFAGFFPLGDEEIAAEQQGKALYNTAPEMRAAIQSIVSALAL